MKYSIKQIEIELKKRLSVPYRWGQKQNNFFDSKTNFIYQTFEFDKLLIEIDLQFKADPDFEKYFNYALNRWYNFWSAYAVESIFYSIDGVLPVENSHDRYRDFIIQGVSFDHKTSVFPKNFPYQIDEAVKRTDELIIWFYEHQSQQQRKHFKNRLFIVLYSPAGDHWKLKAEVSWLKERIEKYMVGFNPNYLLKFKLETDHFTLADIIWAIQK